MPQIRRELGLTVRGRPASLLVLKSEQRGIQDGGPGRAVWKALLASGECVANVSARHRAVHSKSDVVATVLLEVQ